MALQPVVAAAIHSVQPLADGKDLRLELVVGKGTFNVLGDAARLQQVVWNLLSNALKFTPPAGHIQVRVSAIDKALRLQVSDTGQGISPKLLPHIFEAFRQGTTARNGDAKGWDWDSPSSKRSSIVTEERCTPPVQVWAKAPQLRSSCQHSPPPSM